MMAQYSQSEFAFNDSFVCRDKTLEVLILSPNLIGDLSFISEFKLFTTLVLLLIFQRFWNKKYGKANKYYEIPGPSSLPFVGCLHHFVWPGVDLFQLLLGWSRKYKRIAKVKVFHLEGVGVGDPLYIQKILTSVDACYLNKPRLLYDALTAHTLSNGLVFSEYPLWSHHRKVLSRTFSYNGIQDQLRKINFHTKKLIKNLLESSKHNNVISSVNGASISKLLNTTALEIILHIIMDLEITSEEERQEFHKHLQRAKNGLSRRLKEPWLMFQPIYWLHPLRRDTDKCVSEIKKFMKVIVKRYGRRKVKPEENFQPENKNVFEMKKPVKCMMEEMMEAGFSDDDIFQETLTMIYAGHETTSWAIIFFLFKLALNPEIQQRCRREIDELFERLSEEETSSLELNLSSSDLNSLEYLDRCVKESLRLYPIVPVFARRLDAPIKLEDDLILEKGVIVSFSPWLVHRDPDIFPDPDRFLPEERVKRHPYSYLPFSAGVRNCVGWKVAPLTMKLVVAYILRHFEVETTQKLDDLQFEFDITLASKNDINLIFKNRHIIM